MNRLFSGIMTICVVMLVTFGYYYLIDLLDVPNYFVAHVVFVGVVGFISLFLIQKYVHRNYGNKH